jgi:hypothetical protein
MKKNISRSVKRKAAAMGTKVGVMSHSGRPDFSPVGYHEVVGLDVGDWRTHYSVLDLDGELAVEDAVAIKEATLRSGINLSLYEHP